MKKLLLSALVTSLLAGCGSTSKPTPQLTPEQQKQVFEAQKEFQNRLLGGLRGLKEQQQIQQQAESTPVVDETVEILEPNILLEHFNRVAKTGNAATFEIQKNELYIDGRAYLDPVGDIFRVGFDHTNGYFTYLVPVSANTYQAKFFRVGSSETPLHFATVTRDNKGYRVKTVSGETLAGDNILPTSTGFLISRSNGVFNYTIGQGTKSLQLPAGYAPTYFQRGDIASTRLILLEQASVSKGQQESMFDGVLHAFGAKEEDDYAIFDIETGKSVILNMDSAGKNEAVYSDCQRQNDFVRKCAKMHTYESLYTDVGTKNGTHYYWAVDWFNTPAGPMAVYNTGTSIELVDVNGGKQYTLFKRLMGVNEFTLHRKSDGIVSLKAKLGLSNESIENIVEHLATSPGLLPEMARTL